MPAELPALLALLARERPREIELHHMIGHHEAILDLIAGLGVPYDVHVHDYAWLCGRVALVGPESRYCGEPDVVRCEACVADAGSLIEEDITVANLRKRSARLFAGARRVVVPSEDTAARIRRHFPQHAPRLHRTRTMRQLPRRSSPQRLQRCVVSVSWGRSASTRAIRSCLSAPAMPPSVVCRSSSSWSAIPSMTEGCWLRAASSSPAASLPRRRCS